MNKIKMIAVAGARPNFMKIKPFLAAAEAFGRNGTEDGPAVETYLVHTGQHYDRNMSDVFFRELGIRPPDVNLGVGSSSHAAQTAGIMIKFETVCLAEKPDWVVVVGDVNSTVACTMVCAKLGIRTAHIEAGLRSFDRSMPEEINRLVTDALADMLFTPSEDADRNLAREGVPPEKIRLVGNIMIDSLIENIDKARTCGISERLGLEMGKFAYVTLHRPANVDDAGALAGIMERLGGLSRRLPVVFPVHPRTKKMISSFGLAGSSSGRMIMIDPIGYHESLCLAERARLVLTDSGGLQEETTFFRTPCLTLRPNTERPITVTMGSNKLTSPGRLAADIDAVLAGPEKFGNIPPLWDGRTAERIVKELVEASS